MEVKGAQTPVLNPKLKKIGYDNKISSVYEYYFKKTSR